MTKLYFNKKRKIIIELNTHTIKQLRNKAEALKSKPDHFQYLNYIAQDVKIYSKYSYSCIRYTIEEILGDFTELDESYDPELLKLLYERM